MRKPNYGLSVLSGKPQVLIERTFRTLYDNCGFANSFPFQGVINIIEFLKQAGINVFVVTNKPIKPSRSIINRYFNAEMEIISPDCSALVVISKKEMIAFLLEKHDLKAEETIFVGDTASDIIAAHDNGVSAIAAIYGYGEKESLYASQPDFIIDEIKQLKSILNICEG